MKIIKPFIPIVFFWMFMTGAFLLSYTLDGDAVKISIFFYFIVCCISAGLAFENWENFSNLP